MHQAKKPYFGLRGNALTAWLTLACATDMTLFGYDQGVFSGVIVSDNFLDLHGIAGQSELISITTAIYNIGCFLGAIGAAIYGDKWGRKLTIIIGTTIMAIGAALQTTSYSLPQMIVGRIVAGVCNGLNTSTAPVWQADSAKSSWRGLLVVVECVMNIAGFCLVNWINYGLSFAGGGVAWRVPWLPESPRWLVSRDREVETAEIVALIEDRDAEDPIVVMLIEDMKWAVQYERENAPTWRELFTGKTSSSKGGTGTLQRAFLGIACFAMQQGTGINVTSYYLPTLLIESVNLDNETARLLTACNSVQYLFFTVLALVFVERLGRRRMLIMGAAGQAVSFILIAALLSQSEMANTEAKQEVWASASIAFFFLFFFFGFGWMGCSWLYPTEVVSLAMRAKATGLGVATNWIINFMVVLVTPIGIDNIGWKFYIIWAILNALFVPIIYFFYPETANRRLEDIDRYFAEGKRVFVCFDKEATSSKRPARFMFQEEEGVRRQEAGDFLEKPRQASAHKEY
ncbi:general substrate transporter [Hortaea werneckii]|nr:general substrate transporter [Hortaea werneckii]KAI7025389.1 general substrate transporter [Hortaea werneckii]KAI7667408.1 general substrate transporter [Hortaea werneckii]